MVPRTQSSSLNFGDKTVFMYIEKEVVIDMVKNMIIFLSLLVILVCVISIFNARSIAKKKFDTVEENKATKTIKIVGFIVTIGMLLLIYIYR